MKSYSAVNVVVGFVVVSYPPISTQGTLLTTVTRPWMLWVIILYGSSKLRIIPYASTQTANWQKTVCINYSTGLIPCLRPANERRRYFVWRLSLAWCKPRITPAQYSRVKCGVRYMSEHTTMCLMCVWSAYKSHKFIWQQYFQNYSYFS